MVKADLYGHDTHGTFRLRQYANRLRDGGLNPVATLKIVKETEATAVVDGDNGLGHLGMTFATELAIKKAASVGIGWVGVRNGNHAGPASLYVYPVVEHDMIGLYGAVGSANHVPPFGGSEQLLGTNPIAVAVPAGNSPPFVLDMATTVAAAGKIRTLAQRGEPMPEGWMVGRDGKPLTDPKRQGEGIMLPIGGAKGYGLAMALGLLAGTLNGAAFGNVDIFKATVDSVFQTIRSSATLPGYDSVRIPGEHRGEMFEDLSKNGVPLHPKLVEALSEIARELDIPELS
jgi:LDH2 family malate/lactate/ureidoglycolate dehydrogenase